MPQSLKRQDAERIHVQVGHQERHTFRKEHRLVTAHLAGKHSRNVILTCRICTKENPPVSNAVAKAIYVPREI